MHSDSSHRNSGFLSFLSGMRLFLIMGLSFGMFWYVWGEFSHGIPYAQTNIIGIEKPQDIIITPEKAAFFPGQQKSFTVKGVFSYGTLEIPAKWTVQPPDLGKLKCAEIESVSCTFTASSTRVSKRGYITVTTSTHLKKIQITLLPDQGNLILFDDVKTSDWFFSALFDISKYPSILKDVDGPEFKPGLPLSRGEWVAWVEGSLSEKGMLPRSREKRVCRQIFEDVPTSSRFSQSLCRFFSLGWISGLENNGQRYFKPEEPVTREVAARIVCTPFCDYLLGAYTVMGKDLETFYFDDVNSNNEYTDALIELSLYGLFGDDSGGKLRPNEFLTRAEGVVLLQRIFSLLDTKRVDEKGSFTVLQLLHSPATLAKASSEVPGIQSLVPSFGDGSEPLVFEGLNKPGDYRMLAYYSFFDSTNTSYGLGVQSYPVELERVTGYPKPQILLRSFKPHGDLVSFRLFRDGLFSNPVDFEIVFETAPHLSKVSPVSGTEREKFLIKGFQLGSKDDFKLVGTILRPLENSETIENAGYFVQDQIDLWTDTEIWFTSLSTDQLKSNDHVRFQLIPAGKFLDPSIEQSQAMYGLSSNSMVYSVDMESKPVFYSLSKSVGSPVDSLEIYGRNFGLSPDIDATASLTFSCIQKNGEAFTLLSLGEVPVSKIEVWEGGYIRLHDIDGLCNSLLVADKISFALNSLGRISNALEFTLYSDKMPRPILDTVLPPSDPAKNEIILLGRYLGNSGEVHVSYFDSGQKKVVESKIVPYAEWQYDQIVISDMKLSGDQIRISVETRGMRSNEVSLKLVEGSYE